MDDHGLIYPENRAKPKLSVIDGGLAPLPKTKGMDNDDNWLRRLPPGTVFLTRPRAQRATNFTLGEYVVQGHLGHATQLMVGEEMVWVDNRLFSGYMELIEEVRHGYHDERDRSD